MLFKLALLNLWKYRKRTAVVLLGIVLSVIVMQSISSMLAGMQRMFFSDIIRGSGHIQLHAEGWEDRLDRYSLDYLIDRPNDLVRDVEALESVDRVEPILSFGALVSTEEDNIALQGHGVLRETSYYTAVRDGIVAGSFLPEEGPGIVISRENAELLDVGVGDSLSVLVTTTLDSPWYLRYPIVGLFDAGVGDLDESSFFLPLEEAQQLLFAEGRANEIRIMLDDPERASAFVRQQRDLFADYDVAAETWREIHGSILVFVDLSDLMSAVINAFVVIVAASVITNAILMTAFDRLPTFGALRAIGLKRSGLLLMLVNEGVLLGVIGSLLGLAIGVPISLYLEANGLDIGELGRAFGAGSIYYFDFEWTDAFVNFGFGVLVAGLSALYAGVVTIKKSVIETLGEA
jgi:putative ABC transport system permease protein